MRIKTGRCRREKRNGEVTAAALYTLMMACAMAFSYRVLKYSYNSSEIVKSLIYFECVMTVYAVMVYRKYYRGTAFKKIVFTPELGVYGFFMAVITGLYFLQGGYRENPALMPYTVSTTFLVAVSEELMYRGIVLGGLLEKTSKMKAVAGSAALFSLLHAANILAGISLQAMTVQLFNTFIYGVMTGGFRVKTGNILPFMVFHFLWDMMIFSGSFVQKNAFIIFSVSIVNLVFAVHMAVSIHKEEKKTI